jgi:hypothetical protein
LFYNSNIEGSRARATVSVKEKGKTILNGWKKISELPAMPWQDTENNTNFNGKSHSFSKSFTIKPGFFTGLCNKDVYSALKSVDWIKNGKFVRIVLEVLAAMEFVPEADAERFSNIELKSQKFDKPLAAMTSMLFYL